MNKIILLILVLLTSSFSYGATVYAAKTNRYGCAYRPDHNTAKVLAFEKAKELCEQATEQICGVKSITIEKKGDICVAKARAQAFN